ncbi:uncharacterized protein LOC118181196 [Stegodyphus dumicola]|uniref:uncharacterized protein LOC118181196 n=1 Tax=Stegodyphus dumicola TaxID=202533 RepID=UPI0015A824D9|nr:uncharacterized protein LOC118181196 [Stegodyphus dumicola]
MDSIQIIQINLKHSRSATDNLKINFEQNDKFKVASIQEPYTVQNKLYGFPTKYRKFYSQTDAKTAVVIADSNLPVLELFSSPEIIALAIGSDLRFILITVYCPPSQDAPILTTLERFMQDNNNMTTIITGDFNAKSLLWGSHNTDTRGLKVCEFIASTGLSIVNEIGDTPTFAGVSGNSWIDLTLIIKRLRIRIDNSKVTDEANNSDHNNIYFDVSSIHYPTWRRSKINVRHTDWLSFKRYVSKSLADPRNLTTIEEIDKYVREGTTSLHEIYQRTVLSHNSKPKSRNCPWWTKDLTILREKVRATRKRFQKATGEERTHNRLLYQRVRA